MNFEEIETLLKNGEINRAENIIFKAIKESPNDAASYRALAELYIEKGRYTEAAVAAADAYRRDPSSPEILETLGWLYLRDNDLKNAEHILSELVKKDEKNAFGWGNLGLVYSMEARYEEAVSAFLTALRYNAADGTSWANLGALYAEMHDDENAYEAFEKANALNSGDKRIGAYLKTLERRTPIIRYDALVPLPHTPKLFALSVPANFENALEGTVVRASAPDNRVVIALSCGKGTPDALEMERVVKETLGAHDGAKTLYETRTRVTQNGETIIESAAVTKQGAYIRGAYHSFEGRTLLITLSSSVYPALKLDALSDAVFASATLAV